MVSWWKGPEGRVTSIALRDLSSIGFVKESVCSAEVALVSTPTRNGEFTGKVSYLCSYHLNLCSPVSHISLAYWFQTPYVLLALHGQ